MNLLRAVQTHFAFAAAALVLAAAQPAQARGVAELLLEQATKHALSAVAPSAAPVELPPAGSFAPCAKTFPRGAAVVAARHWDATPLCFTNFAVLYSGTSKTPLVVVERLNRAMLADAADEQRTNVFFADPRLPRRSRAELSDYEASGFDRGHLASAADQPDHVSMAESFALSNMVPQDPVNNRKIWKKLESDTRKFARRAAGDVFIFSGPLFRGDPRTIGRNNVWVPSHLFKLVHDQASGRTWGYVLANTAHARIEAPLDYDAFVKATGHDLLPHAASSR